MIKKIARSAGLSFKDETATIVSSACSGMPSCARKACSYIHRKIAVAERPIQLGRDRVKQLVDEFITQEEATLGQVALSHLFRVYPELEKPALAGLSASTSSSPNSGLVTILRKYGVFDSTDPVKPSGEMVKQALLLYREQLDSAQVRAQATLVGTADKKDKTALDEWADDLAVINKQRNLLEKTLRQLVLNFLRADSLAQKKRGNTKNRIVAAIPSERRNVLNQHGADNLIERLMWSELSALIQKEWPIFLSVFGDKKQFTEHATVVNERFDAHAKDADELDLAHYRRSLRWLAERVSNI